MKKTVLALLFLSSLSASAQITVDELLNKTVAAIDNLKKNVDHKTHDIFNSYLASLEKAQQEITTNYEETQIIWKTIQERAKFLEQSLAELENFEKEEVN